MEKAIQTRRRFIVIQLLAYASFASMNYFNIYLKEIGFTGARLGVWNSLCSLTGLITLPLWGVVSDRAGSIRLPYLFSMLIYGACCSLLPAARNNGAVVCAMILLYGFVKTPTHSLGDAWAISSLEPCGIRYPSVRRYGSLGFAVISILYGLIGEKLGTGRIMNLTCVYVIPLAVVILLSGETRHAPKAGTFRPWELFRVKGFKSAFFAVFALAVYSAATQPFYAYILEHAGLKSETFGIISGWGALVQIVCMMLITGRLKNVRREYILAGAGVIVFFEHLLYAGARGIGMMLVAGTLWGFEMAIYVSVLPGYIASLVPEKYAATAQTLSGTAASVFAIAASPVMGVMIDRVGISACNAITGCLSLALTAAFVLTRLMPARKNPPCGLRGSR